MFSSYFIPLSSPISIFPELSWFQHWKACILRNSPDGETRMVGHPTPVGQGHSGQFWPLPGLALEIWSNKVWTKLNRNRTLKVLFVWEVGLWNPWFWVIRYGYDSQLCIYLLCDLEDVTFLFWDSSGLWIKKMSYQAKLYDFDKIRHVKVLGSQ